LLGGRPFHFSDKQQEETRDERGVGRESDRKSTETTGKRLLVVVGCVMHWDTFGSYFQVLSY